MAARGTVRRLSTPAKRPAPGTIARPGSRGSTSLYKPSSVSRPGCPGRGGDHSSRAAVTRRLVRPTRRLERAALRSPAYAALLPMGFAVPPTLPWTRWALTPPFHPYRRARPRTNARRRSFLCGTLLGVAATGRYPASCSVELGLSSRGFRDPALFRTLDRGATGDHPSGVDPTGSLPSDRHPRKAG